jgi:glycosyltransferase involved in cell wall biosynthesis
LMRQCRVVALPSVWLEGFPRVAAEAMSVGRPLLVWDGAGLRRVADLGAGWALSSEPEAWTERLLAITDPEVEARGKAARVFYDAHCSPVAGLEQLLRTYARVTGGSGAE